MSRESHDDVRSTSNEPTARDAGFTLPELLIAMVISGILVVSISLAFTTVLQTQASATVRLAESKDITFVQTWLPVDLSSAVLSFDEPNEAALLAQLAAVTPNSMAYLATLPGTNVLTVIRPDLDAGPGVYYLVSYRYHQVNGQWQISRFEIRNPGAAAEVVKVVGVAHEIPAPPEGWDPLTQKPSHAAEVLTRNGGVIRPVGEDVTVNFESGNQFVTGGAGLSAENQLPTDYSGGFTDPSAPPSRCGGRIALVIDTSGSVPIGFGGGPTESAAVNFIDAFTGTPTSLSLNGFDRQAYGMFEDTSKAVNTVGRNSVDGVRAPFVSLLNPASTVDAMKKRITDLDNLDGAWPGGTASIGLRDPNNDRIMWDQMGEGTNWEDGIWNVFRRTDGTNYGLDQPDLVVFITDGEPNYVRSGADGGWVNLLSGVSGTAAQDLKRTDAANAAKDIANIGRGYGARVIGIMVGDKSGSTKHVNWLKSVVGSQEWNGSVNGTEITIGNAATADLFKGGFSELGNILRSIMIAECGGTVTLQKRIETGAGLENPDSGVWSYTVDQGVRPLDRSKTSSITFDYSFGTGETSKDVTIIEQTVSGYVFNRAECSVRGVPLTADKVKPNPDGSPGATVTVRADEAVSCLMISRPA